MCLLVCVPLCAFFIFFHILFFVLVFVRLFVCVFLSFCLCLFECLSILLFWRSRAVSFLFLLSCVATFLFNISNFSPSFSSFAAVERQQNSRSHKHVLLPCMFSNVFHLYILKCFIHRVFIFYLYFFLFFYSVGFFLVFFFEFWKNICFEKCAFVNIKFREYLGEKGI